MEEILTKLKIQQYQSSHIVTFSSSPDIHYSIWFLANPYPLILTDILAGHNALVYKHKLKNKRIIQIAHPIHAIYIYLFQMMIVQDQGVMGVSSQV
jgi:hypothetical protein